MNVVGCCVKLYILIQKSQVIYTGMVVFRELNPFAFARCKCRDLLMRCFFMVVILVVVNFFRY